MALGCLKGECAVPVHVNEAVLSCRTYPLSVAAWQPKSVEAACVAVPANATVLHSSANVAMVVDVAVHCLTANLLSSLCILCQFAVLLWAHWHAV